MPGMREMCHGLMPPQEFSIPVMNEKYHDLMLSQKYRMPGMTDEYHHLMSQDVSLSKSYDCEMAEMSDERYDLMLVEIAHSNFWLSLR